MTTKWVTPTVLLTSSPTCSPRITEHSRLVITTPSLLTFYFPFDFTPHYNYFLIIILQINCWTDRQLFFVIRGNWAWHLSCMLFLETEMDEKQAIFTFIIHIIFIFFHTKSFHQARVWLIFIVFLSPIY